MTNENHNHTQLSPTPLNLKDGVIDENSLIQCHDKGLYQGQVDYWRWQLNGKAVSEYVDDMQPANGVIEGEFFVLGKIR